MRRFTEAIIDPDSPEMREIEAIVLKNLEDSVKDPVLREKLRPNYRAACKRLIYSSDYYEKVQRPDVETACGAIKQIEPKGVRMADGLLQEVDVLVLATVFHADRFVRPMRLTGRVIAQAGLRSFTVNGAAVVLDEQGTFSVPVPIEQGISRGLPMDLVAIDRQDKQGSMKLLVRSGATAAGEEGMLQVMN